MDVIARPADMVANRVPDPEGRALWRMFHKETMGRMMLIIDKCDNEEHLEIWLKREGFKAFQYHVLDTTDPVIKADKIHTLSASIGRTNWYIDNDPETCALTLKLGIASIMVGNPYIIRPEWSTSVKEIRPWGTLVDEMNRQAELRAEKEWNAPMELPE
jgi:hypothetical protein